jgi:hypothetical protein
MRVMNGTCVNNMLKFRYVLMDSWFGSVEYSDFIVKKKKHFIRIPTRFKTPAFRPERAPPHPEGWGLRVLSGGDANSSTPKSTGLKAGDKLVAALKDNGLIALSEDDKRLCRFVRIDTLKLSLQKRWKVEVFHKSLKSNAAMAKSPTRRVTTQNNDVFVSIYVVIKLECLNIKHKKNRFTLRAKLFLKATQQAYAELQILRAV